jgi:hypothetical protein
MAQIHDRMPVIIDPASLTAATPPRPSEGMAAVPVNTMVHDPKNENPWEVEPIEVGRALSASGITRYIDKATKRRRLSSARACLRCARGGGTAQVTSGALQDPWPALLPDDKSVRAFGGARPLALAWVRGPQPVPLRTRNGLSSTSIGIRRDPITGRIATLAKIAAFYLAGHSRRAFNLGCLCPRFFQKRCQILVAASERLKIPPKGRFQDASRKRAIFAGATSTVHG